MGQLAGLAFVIAVLGLSADAFAQAKEKGVRYIDGVKHIIVTEAQCKSVCQARGWSPSDCAPFCRPGSCRQAKTGSEHFCVARK